LKVAGSKVDDDDDDDGGFFSEERGVQGDKLNLGT
jgi:hypothetical protein